MVDMPEGTTHYTRDATGTITYWKKVKAFGFSLLNYWTGKEWRMRFGFLPWSDLKEISDLKDINYRELPWRSV